MVAVGLALVARAPRGAAAQKCRRAIRRRAPGGLVAADPIGCAASPAGSAVTVRRQRLLRRSLTPRRRIALRLSMAHEPVLHASFGSSPLHPRGRGSARAVWSPSEVHVPISDPNGRGEVGPFVVTGSEEGPAPQGRQVVVVLRLPEWAGCVRQLPVHAGGDAPPVGCCCGRRGARSCLPVACHQFGGP